MAGKMLELIIVFSIVGGLTLAVPALAVLTVAGIKFTANRLMFVKLLLVAIQWRAYLLWFQVRWLRGEQPGHVKLLVLIAVEWMVACFTIGMACAALAANMFALQHDYCTTATECVIYIDVAVMAGATRALAVVSALGMLWILGSQIRPAQAP